MHFSHTCSSPTWNAYGIFWACDGTSISLTRAFYLVPVSFRSRSPAAHCHIWPHCPTHWGCLSSPSPEVPVNTYQLPASWLWACRPGRPRNRWLDHLHQSSSRSPIEEWRHSVCRVHGVGTMLMPSPAMRLWWCWWCCTWSWTVNCIFSSISKFMSSV